MTTDVISETGAARGGVTLRHLRAIADASRASMLERAALVDAREWTDPRTAERYRQALRYGHAWVAFGAVHAAANGWSVHVASEALDAGFNAALAAPYPAAYIAHRGGVASLYFGEQAARELGAFHHAHYGSPFGDLADSGSALLMTHLGQTEPTTEANHDYRARLCDAYAAGLAGN